MQLQPIFKTNFNNIPTYYTVITSRISGGCFRTYLADMMRKYDGRICLHLQPMQHSFRLPCYDGQGEVVKEPIEAKSMSYSASLCCNWYFQNKPPTVFLFDDNNTLRNKVHIAEDVGIPFVAADEAILQKIKTP